MSRNKKTNSENQEPEIKETRKEALTRLFLENGLVKDTVKLRLLDQYYKGENSGADNFTSIVSMKLSVFKYRVFSQNGILMNQVDFSKQVRKYG